ncbi:SDR family oxidoreductase [Xanthobacter versatilis]|uniref:SDR family oxidoreductase n=1 Tax=Xanthobacter autotrophicus (strain ATCC BAA-1158 / Py2) TaxID=78245 RepID=UPI003728621C
MSELLVVGATGSIGRHVVAVALREGHTVRALVRDERRGRQFPQGVDTVVGDLTRADTLGPAVDGIDAVVFTHGSNGRPPGSEAVDYGAVRNVLSALRGRKVRIALMTAIGVTDRKGAHDWKRRGERLIRVSGMAYTIVRPGWFDYNAPDQHRLVLLQGDRRQSGTPRDGVVARHQIAEVLVRSLRSEAANRKTFELIAETGPEPDDFDALFAPLDADPRGAIDGAHDMANMPVDGEPPSVRADLEALFEHGPPAG